MISSIGNASMSARSATARLPGPPRSTPTTPQPPTPVTTSSRPKVAELLGNKGGGLVEGVEQFGTAMQIATPEHGFAGDGGNLFKGGQGLTSLRTIAEEVSA